MPADMVDSPPRSDPPYVPIRHTRWPVRRTPRPLIAAGLVLLVIAVLVGLAHRPSAAQRAADLRGFIHDMNADIESCAGGVGESLTVLHAVQSGASHDTQTAIKIARVGAANCSPANNELLADLTQYQVTGSLASFRLARVVSGLVTWASPDAERVQSDVADLLAASSPQARARASAALRQARAKLDVQRSAVDSVIESASAALSAHVAPPRLPG
jgi:hypothetical protein